VSSSSTKLVLSLVAEEERAFQERIYVGVQRSSRIASEAPNVKSVKSSERVRRLQKLRKIRHSLNARVAIDSLIRVSATSVARWRSRNRLPNRSHESKTNARRKGRPSIFPHPHQIESERPPARGRASSRTIVTLRSLRIVVQPWSFPGSVARQKRIRDDRGDRGDFRSSIKSLRPISPLSLPLLPPPSPALLYANRSPAGDQIPDGLR